MVFYDQMYMNAKKVKRKDSSGSDSCPEQCPRDCEKEETKMPDNKD
jgi:hypothetical protein